MKGTEMIKYTQEILASIASDLLLLRCQGFTKEQIVDLPDWGYSKYKYAARYIKDNSLTLEKSVMQETSKTEEIASKSPENRPKKSETEKPKPVRISQILEKSLNLPLGKVHRFIVTSAQDDTPVHDEFWKNLKSFAEFQKAEIIVAGFTYQKGLFEDHNQATGQYDPRLHEYMEYDRVHVSDSLMIVSDANVLPTSANPLNGWMTVNHGDHVVVPHARIALKSIPRMQGQPARYAVSTGCCTIPSYAPRAAGRKAIFHHTYGALLVEVDTDGATFFRHIIAADDGSFHDFDALIADGQVYEGYRAKSITWGDIHHEQLNALIARISFGVNIWSNKVVTRNNILDWLQPEYQIFEDTLDFRRRNHHGINDPHERARIEASSDGNVEDEVRMATAFVNACQRPWTRAIVVESNHDAALAKWLKNHDGAADAENAYYWHRLNAHWHDEIRANNKSFNVVEFAMRSAGLDQEVEFLGAGGSFMIGDVECGLHGDLGINGARSAPAQYRRFGVKTTSGHTHSPEIIDGQYVAGVSANLDQGYNKGPSSWGHGHVIQYQNDKRCIILIDEDGRFCATGDRVFEEIEFGFDEEIDKAA